MNIKEISVHTLKELTTKRKNFVLLDIRESHEINKASIEPHLHIAMNTLPRRLSEVNKDEPIYVLCHTGTRSWYATRFLQDAGFDASNIQGGIHAWSIEIDPSVPTY